MATRRTISSNPPLIVIVGPTASGKTGLAVRMAKRYGGEIICADSRTIYKEMDIGTAKPTYAEQKEVPHWGIDLVNPGERFSAADFKEYATAKIAEVRRRGKVPFLVGGTGLYIDAVLFDYRFGIKTDAFLRQKLESYSVEELQNYCNSHNINLPKNIKNRRHLIHAIEQGGMDEQREKKPISNSIIVGIATDKHRLNERIQDRAEQLFDESVVDEAIVLGKKYGWEGEAFTGNIYRIVRLHLEGKVNLDEIKERFIISDRQLAKRQLTWLKRNPYIRWLPLEEAEDYLDNILATVR